MSIKIKVSNGQCISKRIKVTCISHVALIETENLVHFVKNSLYQKIKKNIVCHHENMLNLLHSHSD